MNPSDLPDPSKIDAATLEQTRQSLSERLASAGDGIGNLINGVTDIGSELLDAVDVDAIGGMVSGAGELLGSALENAGDVAGAVGEGAGSVIEALGGILGDLGG